MVILPFLLIQEGQFFSYWQMYVHKVLVNCFIKIGLSLPRKSVSGFTGRLDMTIIGP